jgi:phage terminase large subunit GpA-like protein
MNTHYKLVKEGQQQEIQEIPLKAAADWSITLPDGTEKHYVLTGDLTAGRIAGFHLSRLYSPFVTWGQMAEEWLSIGDDLSKRQTFYNAALALPWKQKSVDIEIEMLLEHIDRDLPARVVPAGYEFIVAAADYHGPRYGVRFVTLAVRRDFAVTLIDYGELGSLEEFGAYLRSSFGSETEGAAPPPAVHFGVCDAGWETKEVVDFCAQQPKLSRELHFVTPIQGAGGVGFRNLYTLAPITGGDKRGRSAARQGMKQLIIHPSHWKNQVLYQLTEIPWLDRSEPPPAGHVRMHRDCGADLWEELTSEKRMERVNKRTGRKETEWVVVKKGKNHYWDAFCYARAAADLYLSRFAVQRPRKKRRIGRMERS